MTKEINHSLIINNAIIMKTKSDQFVGQMAIIGVINHQLLEMTTIFSGGKEVGPREGNIRMKGAEVPVDQENVRHLQKEERV
jgi:hypothetical protein